MAVKTAINGMIVLQGGDTYPAGGKAYTIEAVTICAGGGGGEYVLYGHGGLATDPVITRGFSTNAPQTFHLGGVCSTGAGLFFDAGSADSAHIYVK